MKAIDTNVLVRFLVRDDPDMTEKTRRLFEKARDAASPLLVSNLVLLETFWVLRSSYGFTREEITDAVRKLLVLPSIAFESYDSINEFISEASSSNADLADILIGVHAKSSGAETTLTFDVKAARSNLFAKL